MEWLVYCLTFPFEVNLTLVLSHVVLYELRKEKHDVTWWLGNTLCYWLVVPGYVFRLFALCLCVNDFALAQVALSWQSTAYSDCWMRCAHIGRLSSSVGLLCCSYFYVLGLYFLGYELVGHFKCLPTVKHPWCLTWDLLCSLLMMVGFSWVDSLCLDNRLPFWYLLFSHLVRPLVLLIGIITSCGTSRVQSALSQLDVH